MRSTGTALCLILWSCATTDPPVAEVAKAAEIPPAEQAPPPPRGEPITVVGVVHEDGVQVCDGHGHETWIDKYYLAGFTPLVAEGTVREEVAALYRRAVVVHGWIQAPPPARTPPSGAPCPIPQMRSDWVITADGPRVRRGTRAATGIAVTDIRVFEGLEVAFADDDHVRIELTNTFDVPLTGTTTILVHYEGCFGKPGTRSTTQEREEPLPPGESWSFVVPRLQEDPQGQSGRRLYRLASVQIKAAGEQLAFDFDAAPHELGAQGVRCPDGHKGAP